MVIGMLSLASAGDWEELSGKYWRRKLSNHYYWHHWRETKKTPPAVRPVVTILSKSFSSIDHVFAYICDQAGEREPLVLNILHISPLRTSATHRNWQHLGSLSVPIDQRNVPALQFHPAQIEIGWDEQTLISVTNIWANNLKIEAEKDRIFSTWQMCRLHIANN